MIPQLQTLLEESAADLCQLLSAIKLASDRFELAEKRVDNVRSSSGPVANLSELRVCRAQFQDAIEQLSKAQNEYVRHLNRWVERIASHGVILRDLQEGLLDFPAQKNGFRYLLCWKINEADIGFWHLENDGYMGRKPLAALEEYC